MSIAMGFEEMEPQINAPKVAPLEGVSTYAPQGIRVRGVENPQGFGVDERRLIASAHRKGSEKCEVQQQYLDFCIKKLPQHRTRMTQIGRIITDNFIRGHPRNPCNPCSITFASDGKRSYQWSFSLITR
ncbi:hypothetical protein ig2599ANME_2026 [groundwater metagenome]